MNDAEKAVCRKIGSTFELAGKENYSPVDFTKKWLKSETARNLYNMNFNEIAQSKIYQLHYFEDEVGTIDRIIPIEDNPNIMLWCGYTLSCMIFEGGYRPEDLERHYDIPRIIGNYDVLHTLSTKTAIEEIENEFRLKAAS